MVFFSTSKSVPAHWAGVAVLSVTLTLDLQGQIQGQTTENVLETKVTTQIAFFNVGITAIALGKCQSTFGDLDL